MKVTVKNPPKVQVKISGYTGEPTGEIELTENHKTYYVKPYAEAVTNIPDPVLIEKTITANGEYSAQSDNADGYSEVTVNVWQMAEIDLQSLTPVAFGADDGGLYMTTEENEKNTFFLGRDNTGLYVKSGVTI